MQTDFANLDDRVVFNTNTALFFHACQNDAERFVTDWGIDRLEVAVEYISAKYDNVDAAFRAACARFNKQGLYRLTYRDGRTFAPIFEKMRASVEPTPHSKCRYCSTFVVEGDSICDECNRKKYGTHRFGGEVPAGVDW